MFDRAVLLRHGRIVGDGMATDVLSDAMVERLYAPPDPSEAL